MALDKRHARQKSAQLSITDLERLLHLSAAYWECLPDLAALDAGLPSE